MRNPNSLIIVYISFLLLFSSRNVVDQARCVVYCCYHPSKDFFQAYGVTRIGIQTACMIVAYDYRAVSVTACDTGPWFLWFQSKDSSHSHWQWNCGYQHLKEKMYRCLRMEFEFYLALACRKKEIKLGRLFGWDRKNRGHVSQQVWHDKDPSSVNGRKCRTQP